MEAEENSTLEMRAFFLLFGYNNASNIGHNDSNDDGNIIARSNIRKKADPFLYLTLFFTEIKFIALNFYFTFLMDFY